MLSRFFLLTSAASYPTLPVHGSGPAIISMLKAQILMFPTAVRYLTAPWAAHRGSLIATIPRTGRERERERFQDFKISRFQYSPISNTLSDGPSKTSNGMSRSSCKYVWNRFDLLGSQSKLMSQRTCTGHQSFGPCYISLGIRRQCEQNGAVVHAHKY
jgi:hypothetical protein